MKQEEFKKLLLESKFPDEAKRIFKAIESRLNFLEARISKLERRDTK